MNLEQFCRDLEGMLDRPAGSIQPGMDLLDIPEWDSMQNLTFSMFAEERYKKKVSAVAVTKATTVDGLFNLVSS